VAIQAQGNGWIVICRLCDYLSDEQPDCDSADDLAYDHVVQAHPEVREP